MMRMIDADAITYTWIVDADGEEHDGVTLQSVIQKMPTVSVPVVIREVPVDVVCCKDCRLSYKEGKSKKLPLLWCRKWRTIMRECDFCSFAEREEKQETTNE